MGLTVVYGPPCSGKTTYVRNQAKPGDLILDYDEFYAALSGMPAHTWPERDLRPFVMAAMNSALKEWRRRGTAACWLIRTAPSESDVVDATLVRCDPGIEVCLARAQEQGRPQATLGIVSWYETHGDRAASSTPAGT